MCRNLDAYSLHVSDGSFTASPSWCSSQVQHPIRPSPLHPSQCPSLQRCPPGTHKETRKKAGERIGRRRRGKKRRRQTRRKEPTASQRQRTKILAAQLPTSKSHSDLRASRTCCRRVRLSNHPLLCLDRSTLLLPPRVTRPPYLPEHPPRVTCLSRFRRMPLGRKSASSR